MSSKAKVFLVLVVVCFVLWGGVIYGNNVVTCQYIEAPNYTSRNVDDQNMYIGEQKIVQDGVSGTTRYCYSKTKTISNTVTIQPIEQIISVGVKPTPTPIVVSTPAPTIEAVPPTSNNYRCPITTCRDGSCSSSTGRGTCSWHGGIAY